MTQRIENPKAAKWLILCEMRQVTSKTPNENSIVIPYARPNLEIGARNMLTTAMAISIARRLNCGEGERSAIDCKVPGELEVDSDMAGF